MPNSTPMIEAARAALARIGEMSAKATEPPWVDVGAMGAGRAVYAADAPVAVFYGVDINPRGLSNAALTPALRNAAPSLIAWVLAQADYIAALEEIDIPEHAVTGEMRESVWEAKRDLDTALARFVDEAGRRREGNR